MTVAELPVIFPLTVCVNVSKNLPESRMTAAIISRALSTHSTTDFDEKKPDSKKLSAMGVIRAKNRSTASTAPVIIMLLKVLFTRSWSFA